MNVSIEKKSVSYLATAIFSAIFLLPLAFYGCGPEWARWDAAQAELAWRRGDLDGAIEQLQSAVVKSPRDPVLRINLADYLNQQQRGGEALEQCEKVLDRYPDHRGAYQMKVTSLQTQGRFAEALRVHQFQSAKFRRRSSTTIEDLNTLAYLRALAGRDLAAANVNISQAIANLETKVWQYGPEKKLEITDVALMTASLIARRLDQKELLTQAIEKLTEHIDRRRDLVHQWIEDLNEGLIREAVEIRYGAGLDNRLQQELSQGVAALRKQIRNHEASLATLLTVRALCFQDLEQQENCDQDRDEVRGMNFDSNEILADLPDLQKSLMVIQRAASYLDTRGLVRLKRVQEDGVSEVLGGRAGQLEKLVGFADQASRSGRWGELYQSALNLDGALELALVDLDLAVFAQEMFYRSLASNVHNFTAGLISDPARVRRVFQRQLATVIYHRWLIFRMLDRWGEVGDDTAKLRALGYRPGPHLF